MSELITLCIHVTITPKNIPTDESFRIKYDKVVLTMPKDKGHIN